MDRIGNVVHELRDELGPWWPLKVLLVFAWLYVDVVLFLGMAPQ